MSLVRKPDPQTIERQTRASDPSGSAWVSAHAGSGKTHVLASRVIRLLLAGVAPARILCLTFTKAAAANMNERVFGTLAKWAVADDATLAALMEKTGAAGRIAPSLARKLFARAVETPGGLKIQTIHAFCERILHLFPFEANVPAAFSVLGDLQGEEMLEAARRSALARLAVGDDRSRAALATVAAATWDGGFVELVRAMLAQRDVWRGNTAARRETLLRTALNLAPDDTRESTEHAILESGIHSAQWRDIAARMGKGSKTDQDRARALRTAADALPGAAAVTLYFDVFRTQKGDWRAKIINAPLAKLDPALAALLDAEKSRLVALYEKWLATGILDRTAALDLVCGAVLADYERAKQAAGLLDFGDLIALTKELLTQAHGSQWVLFKLDGGIDHILVDEAQDTSEAQWAILEALAQEFSAGEGRPRPRRTFFAVGDEKQSIFSFQGAAPAMFDAMLRQFRKRADEAQAPFAHVPLHLSFRSAPDILAAVDVVFSDASRRKGLSADAAAPIHEALKKGLPGLVELWPKIAGEGSEPPDDWVLPVDAEGRNAPSVLLAHKVARKIARLVDPSHGEAVEDDTPGVYRQIARGDIMVLVRRRDAFFEAIIRALKHEGVAVAGADRLDVAGHIAVMDCVAVGRVALLPDDDLMLATVLKSPFLGLDDDDLIALAPGREGRLFDALRQSKNPRHAAATARIEGWRARATGDGPFDFFMALLGSEGGRRALVARLGLEANDALDEFLALTLAHEHASAPSLVTFLAAMESLTLNVKRDLEAAGDAVRVMTVHAAKGLEAKVVFLPDTCAAPGGQHDPKLFKLDVQAEKVLAWTAGKQNDPAVLVAARERAREEQDDEYRRLLYVAMTRAEERLYIAGWYNKRTPPAHCWYDLVDAALRDTARIAPDTLEDDAEILQLGSTPPRITAPVAIASPAAAGAPAWLATHAPREHAAEPPLRPSSALAGADRRDESDGARRTALVWGVAVHALLRRLPSLPASRRRRAAEDILAEAGVAAGDRTTLIDSVETVMAHPTLAPLFAADALAEVAICAQIERAEGSPIAVAGQIDRLAETSDAILAAEFKTSALPAAGPPRAHVTQIALYAAALAKIYPGRTIRATLVYTPGPDVVTLDARALDAALMRALA